MREQAGLQTPPGARKDGGVQKETSMILQKEMIAAHYKALEEAAQTGRKVVYTFVPGNLNELIRCFDNLLPVHPEINALQNAMRKRTGKMVTDAEKLGHSEDVCTYVKADIGMLRAGNVLPVEEHTALLEEYQAEVERAQRPQLDNSRIVLTGSFCEQPPLGLIRTIERSGCYIVEDDFVLGSRWITGPVAEQGDGLENLVGAFLNQSVETASVYIADKPKGAALVSKCHQRKGEGVIFCAASFCDPALLDQPMLTKAVEAAGIPFTEFKYSENTGQFQVIKEQTGTFSDSIKLWGHP